MENAFQENTSPLPPFISLSMAYTFQVAKRAREDLHPRTTIRKQESARWDAYNILSK